MPRLTTLVATGLIAIAIALAGFARPAWTQQEDSAPTGLRSLNDERAAYRSSDAGQVREVRLALVCYGGSSLAIYIHGNTKEIHRLVQASKALQQDATATTDGIRGAMQQAIANGERPGPGKFGRELTGSTRQWYDRLLQNWIDDPQKVRTRIVVDVIAGTSAGGINGVILAKALAHDLPVDGLTQLWLNKASLAKLTNHYFGLLRILIGRPPIDGDAMVGWLFEALNGMDALDQARGGTPSLLPKGDRLDLFVTTTDRFGYPQNLVVGNPAAAVERRNRHVLHFVYPGVHRGCDPKTPRPPGEIDFFCPEWTPSLTFAARATSSIPGVFPPLNLEDTLAKIAKLAADGPPPAGIVTPAPLDQVVRSFFRNYQLQEPDEKIDYATNTYFVDGGVLDNHPFDPAIAAIVGRPQDQEVRRFLIYLQPDPGTPPTGPKKVKNPGLLKTVWAGLSGIPSGQPILDSLNDIASRNAQLERIRDIVQAEELAARNAERPGSATADCADLERLPIAQRFGCSLGFEPGNLNEALRVATQSDLKTVRLRLEDAAEKGYVEKEKTEKREAAAAEGLDSTGRSYINLRVHSVLAQFVTVIAGGGGCDYPEETAQRTLVAKIISQWALAQNLIGQPQDPAAFRQQHDAQRSFLEDFDVGYQRRQLRFVIDWINDQYTTDPAPTPAKRQTLDALKSAAADRVEDLTALVRGTSLDPDLRRELDSLGPLFCRLRPWDVRNGQMATLDRQAEAFLADARNAAALGALREKLGTVMNRTQQQVRDRSFEDFKRLAQHLTLDEQKEILVRYLGFPFWDRQIYPYVAFSGAGELRDVNIYRLSPNDAALLGRRTASQKLQGAKAAHFGAFFSRKGRESDYLWGRLDAGDRLLDMLGMGTDGARPLFEAILAEERAVGLVRQKILADREAEIAKLP
jgi:predicted acylesterase/phospholipase RssA